MRRAFLYTAASVAAAAAAVVVVKAVAAGRARTKAALARAERVATDTREAVTKVEDALRETRTAF